MSYTKIKIKRHIAKAISYRFIGTLQTMIIGYILTGNFIVASSMGLVELLIKPIVYFLHERVWYKWIKFGVVNVQDKKIKVKELPDDGPKILNETTSKSISKKSKPSDEHTASKPRVRKTLNYTSNR